MPTNFIFRFEKANLFILFQMPNKRQRQAAANRQTTPEDAKRSSVIARMEKIKDQLQIPEYVEQNQPRVWLEESYDVGDLVFAFPGRLSTRKLRIFWNNTRTTK